MVYKAMYYDQRVLDVGSVEQFLAKYYKPERYGGRGKDYADALLASYKAEMKSTGFTYISRHDSKTGDVVSLYQEDIQHGN